LHRELLLLLFHPSSPLRQCFPLCIYLRGILLASRRGRDLKNQNIENGFKIIGFIFEFSISVFFLTLSFIVQQQLQNNLCIPDHASPFGGSSDDNEQNTDSNNIQENVDGKKSGSDRSSQRHTTTAICIISNNRELYLSRIAYEKRSKKKRETAHGSLFLFLFCPFVGQGRITPVCVSTIYVLPLFFFYY
jgi:hypothetical protein